MIGFLLNAVYLATRRGRDIALDFAWGKDAGDECSGHGCSPEGCYRDSNGVYRCERCLLKVEGA